MRLNPLALAVALSFTLAACSEPSTRVGAGHGGDSAEGQVAAVKEDEASALDVAAPEPTAAPAEEAAAIEYDAVAAAGVASNGAAAKQGSLARQDRKARAESYANLAPPPPRPM